MSEHKWRIFLENKCLGEYKFEEKNKSAPNAFNIFFLSPAFVVMPKAFHYESLFFARKLNSHESNKVYFVQVIVEIIDASYAKFIYICRLTKSKSA